MTPQEMARTREAMGYSQLELATFLGMSLAEYQQLENEELPIKPIHTFAVLYASMMLSVIEEDASIAPPNARDFSLKLAKLITSQPESRK